MSSGQRTFLLSRLRVWYLVLPSNGGSPWVCFGGSNFFLFQITLSRRFEKSRFQGPLLHSVQNGTLSPPVEGNYSDDDPALCLTMWQSVAVRFCFGDVASLGSSMSVYSSRLIRTCFQKLRIWSCTILNFI